MTVAVSKNNKALTTMMRLTRESQNELGCQFTRKSNGNLKPRVFEPEQSRIPLSSSSRITFRSVRFQESGGTQYGPLCSRSSHIDAKHNRRSSHPSIPHFLLQVEEKILKMFFLSKMVNGFGGLHFELIYGSSGDYSFISPHFSKS